MMLLSGMAMNHRVVDEVYCDRSVLERQASYLGSAAKSPQSNRQICITCVLSVVLLPI